MTLLARSVHELAALIAPLPESKLKRAWKFGGYQEGVRFAALETALELRQLAVQIHHERAVQSVPLTSAQRIMAQYNTAYRDLHGVLLGVKATDLDKQPTPKDWSVRATLQHMMAVALSFHTTIQLTLENHRAGLPEPLKVNVKARQAKIESTALAVGISEGDGLSGDVGQVMTRFDRLHARIVDDMAALTEPDLSLPSIWWEGYLVPVRFRTHRYEIHLRQHIAQIDKALVGFSYPISEARQLARGMYDALGEAEGASICAAGLCADLEGAAAETIRIRAQEVMLSLAPKPKLKGPTQR